MALNSIVFNLVRSLNPEHAHWLTIQALKLGITPNYKTDTFSKLLTSKVFGISFPNPIGLAAGFDKSAEAFTGLSKLGCGFLEVGTLTLRPQPGNERPRVFRLNDDHAIINRYGFNNHGLDQGIKRLARRKKTAGIIGVNVGINKDSTSPATDYVEGLKLVLPVADYITINISSPNTPGLRDLQTAEKLEKLLSSIDKTLHQQEKQLIIPPILLKIAPDLTKIEIQEITKIALNKKISGLIVSNTTTTRPNFLKSNKQQEAGGLSGPPIFDLSTKKLAETYLACNGHLPLIGVGGIDSAETAYMKIKAGANLVQLYTALTYKGPNLFRSISNGLTQLLKNDKYKNVQDAVGVDAEYWANKAISD